jgi:hypothetical protein
VEAGRERKRRMTNLPEPPEIPEEPDPRKGGGSGRLENRSWDQNGDCDHEGGEVVEVTDVYSKRWDRWFKVLLLQADDGLVRVPCFRAHLAALIVEHDVQVGDVIMIRHWQPAPGERAHRYALRKSVVEEPPADDGVPY